MTAPGTDVFALNVVITAALVVALPFARRWAGLRAGEAIEARAEIVTLTALGAVLWITITGALGASGLLEHWDRMPPPMLIVLVVAIVLTCVLALGSFGNTLAQGLPLWALVGYQGFRVAVELMLHRAYEQGVIGVQMTWSGRNFDVVSGVSALLLGFCLWRRGESRPVPSAIVWLWNLLGIGLLANIVVVAVLSMPTPLRAFDGPANNFVATFPYVWLPTVMVTAALFGHVLVARRLVKG